MIIASIKPRDKSIEYDLNLTSYDKSISHRSIIFSFLSNQRSRIKNLLIADDVLHSLRIAIALGMEVHVDDKVINDDFTTDVIKNNSEITLLPNIKGIFEPNDVLYCGNSGTSIRLYTGLLATIEGYFVLSGDKYLRKRPMDRIIKPLSSIGANIIARYNNTFAPISIIGSKLKSFNYTSSIPSAQVKSAMLLSALRLDSMSIFKETFKSRDHSENILLGMGANIKIDNCKVIITPSTRSLDAIDINIPIDPSSAFYFAILAAINPGIKITIRNVLLNKTRLEAFYVLQKMGASIKFINRSCSYEYMGDITILASKLTGVEVIDNIPWLIDDIPALSIAFCVANGKSVVRNAGELRVKESNRISSILSGLRKLGVECEEFDDGFSIIGGFKYKKARINSYGDHRIAMSFAILGTLFSIEILDSKCIETSFPDFFKVLSKFAFVEIHNGN